MPEPKAEAPAGEDRESYALLKTLVVMLVAMWIGGLLSTWLNGWLARIDMALPAYIGAMLVAAAILVILSIGQSFVITTGGIDLSISATMTVGAVGFGIGWSAGWGFWLSALAAEMIFSMANPISLGFFLDKMARLWNKYRTTIRPSSPPSPLPRPRSSMLIRSVEIFLTRHGMSATQFGRDAADDPRLVSDLRAGREPRPPHPQSHRHKRRFVTRHRFARGDRARYGRNTPHS